MFQTIIGTSLILLGIYFLYVGFCILRIPNHKYEKYKSGLGSMKDVFWGNGTTAKECVHHSDARDSITGKLKIKSSYTSSETKSLFP